MSPCQSPCPYFTDSNTNSTYRDSDEEEIDIPGCEEDSLSESSLLDYDANFPNFEIVLGGTVREKDLLLDGLGYKYTIHHTYPNSKTWRCTHRKNKHNLKDCMATVREVNGDFTFG